MNPNNLSTNSTNHNNIASPKLWLLLQTGVFILAIIPSIGTFLIVLTAILAWFKYAKIASKSILNWLLGILSLWLIFTSFLAPYPTEAFLGLANYLPFFFVFSSVHFLFDQPLQLRQITWLIILPSLLVVTLGLGQLYLGWQTPYLLDWALVKGGVPTGRMSSVFIYANFLAIYLQIVLILGFGLWLETYQKIRQKQKIFADIEATNLPFLINKLITIKFQPPFFRKTAKHQTEIDLDTPPIQKASELAIFNLNSYQNQIFILLSLILVLDGIGLILSSSRNSWMLTCLGAIAFCLYLGWYKVILALATMILTVIWSAIGADPLKTWLRQIIPMSIWARLSDEMYPDRTVETLRMTQWQFTIDLIKQHPLTGWGLRNFTPLYEAKWNLWLGHPHNLFLMFTAETGFFGITLLISFVGLILMKTVLLLQQWSKQKDNYDQQNYHLILFTYLIAFSSCILFNCLDVSLFDLRVNMAINICFRWHEFKILNNHQFSNFLLLPVIIYGSSNNST
jgi:hypothetical protein